MCLNVCSVQSFYDVRQLHKLITSAKSARCRQRFAVPVILYDGKVVDVCNRRRIGTDWLIVIRTVLGQLAEVLRIETCKVLEVGWNVES